VVQMGVSQYSFGGDLHITHPEHIHNDNATTLEIYTLYLQKPTDFRWNGVCTC
jgi:hypothetical protein